MENISYDSGRRPFVNDEKRGKWASKWDFYLASIGHAFGIQNFLVLSIFREEFFGVAFLVIHIIYAFLFLIPMYFVESSLGQFAGTGFISTFRMSPLFKGVGYIILLLNIATASYYSVLASYPLWYFFMSFQSELPWMNCSNKWNTEYCATTNISFVIDSPSFEYFHYNVLQGNHLPYITHIVWPILGCSILIWILIYLCNRNGIKSIGPIIRYATITAIGILLILFIRSLFLPNIFEKLDLFFTFDLKIFAYPELYYTPMFYIFITFGSGWGTVMTMSSYNDFKLNTIKYSIIVPLVLHLITIVAGYFIFSTETYMLNNFGDKSSMYWPIQSLSGYIYDMVPYFFGTIETSQIWSALFFLMLFLSEMNALMIQVFTILTAIFDEYEFLRNYKKIITIGICATLSLTTFLYANNTALNIFSVALPLSGLMQMFICFVELIIVVWIYGRLRFQRDMEFMLGRKIPTWIFYIIRIITPIFSCLFTIGFILFGHDLIESRNIFVTTFLTFLTRVLPCAFIFGYIIYQIWKTTGTIKDRFKKCLQPRDWYPAAQTDREIYTRSVGTSEVSQQLIEMNESNTRQNLSPTR